jgi:hypothetical protein
MLRHALPSGTFERLDQSRRWRRYRKAGIVFVHVPKAAGSGVAAVLYGGRLGHHPATRLMREDPEGWAALDKFAIVREPVSRFLSAYAFALGAGTQEGAIRWRPEYEQPAFRDANVFVRDYLARGAIYDKDLVFWPQTHFVCSASGHPVSGLRLFTTRQFEAVEQFLTVRGHAAPPRLNRGRPTAGLNLDLSPDTRRLLDALYAADFKWFQPLESE